MSDESGEPCNAMRTDARITELHPSGLQSFAATSDLLGLLGREKPIDADRLFGDLDDLVDQGLTG